MSTVAQHLLLQLTGERSGVVPVMAAIVLAIGFAPLKARVQALVDRRLKVPA